MTSHPPADSWHPPAGTRQAEVLEAIRERGSIRIGDLAEELGVTAITVRRDVTALADAGLIRRFHGGAATMDPQRTRGNGFSPVRKGAIGVLVPSFDFYWPDVVHGAEAEANRLGLRLILRETRYHAEDERPDLDQLLSKRVSGLLLAPTVVGAAREALERWLAETKAPVVLMEREMTVGTARQSIESVVTDHAGGADIAVHHLYNQGHRKIALIYSENSPHAAQIGIGWRAAHEELGLDPAATLHSALPDRTDPGFGAAVDEVLTQLVRSGTTSAIIHSDPEAMYILQRAEERGIQIPTDLSIVSYDDQIAALANPALSAVRPPRRIIGETALRLLTDRIADPNRPIHRVKVSPTLIVRASSGPRAQTS